MDHHNVDRTKLFRVALAASGHTIESFAQEQNVSGAAIHRVLRGQSKSKRLSKKIDSLIDEQFAKLQILHQCSKGRKRAA